MKKVYFFLIFLFAYSAIALNIPLSDLPLNSDPTTVQTLDSFPYVKSGSPNVTQRLLISGLPTTPAFTSKFNLYALLNSSPVFTGTVTASSFTASSITGTLTGNVIGNLTGNVTGNLTGNATGTLNTPSFTANRALASDASKNIVSLSTTDTEVGYVHLVTSPIQAQIDGKQGTGNYITSLTNDGTASGPGAAAFTLATVNSNVGTFGGATKASVVTVNGKGLVTAASESTVTPAVGSITGLGTGVATFLATPSSANLASALTDETGTGTVVFSTGSTIDLTSATGLPLTTGTTGVLAETHGGTNQSTYTLGDTLYASAANTLSKLAGNTTSTKKFLRQTGTGTVSAAPAWDTIVGSDLPNPSSSTLGGVQSIAAVSHNFLTSISTSGVPAQAQPAFTDVSGTLASTQMPTFAGDISNSGTTLSYSAIVPLSKGGTNSNLTAVTGGVVVSTASSMTVTAVGNSLTVLTSNGTGNLPTFQSPQSATTGAVVNPLGTGNITLIGVEFGSSSSTVCSSSPCAKTNNPGTGFGTITRNSAGDYTANFTTSFSAAPVCTCNCYSQGAAAQKCVNVLTSVSSFGLRCYTDNAGTGTIADGYVDAICMGAK